MYRTIIVSLLLALVGFAGAAQASDHARNADRDRAKVARETMTDNRGDRDHDNYKRADRSRESHDEDNELDDNDDESHERRDRR